MSPIVSQVVFFRVKRSVKPEDPSSIEGKSLMRIFQATQHQSGHARSSWGYTFEDKDTIVWVVGEFSIPETILKLRYTYPPLETYNLWPIA